MKVDFVKVFQIRGITVEAIALKSRGVSYIVVKYPKIEAEVVLTEEDKKKVEEASKLLNIPEERIMELVLKDKKEQFEKEFKKELLKELNLIDEQGNIKISYEYVDLKEVEIEGKKYIIRIIKVQH